MKKHILAFTITGTVALGIFTISLASTPASVAGSWRIDSRHSYAEIVTDGTTQNGAKKIDITIGFARLNGELNLNDSDSTKSRVDFRIYPANAIAPAIGEDGKVRAQWFENLANHTLVCFHSTSVARTANGKLKVAGKLTLTRVDRNVDSAPGEAYAGPVYGPPMVHRVSQDTTLILDVSDKSAVGEKAAGIYALTSTKVFREDFPQLTRAIVNTAWPPLIQDQDCEAPAQGEAYSGQKCTGTYLAPRLPASPTQAGGEDYPGPQDFNAIAGERVTFQIQMHLIAQSSK